MHDINKLFRNRIGYPLHEPITFDQLDQVLKKTAYAMPFENLNVINGQVKTLSEENLIEKLLVRGEGGLCYELNPMLYLFLRENGFDVSLIRGVVFNQRLQEWSSTGKTHVAILLRENGKKYIVDTGFGANIPLTPVPLYNELVQSSNGEFRVIREKSEHGDSMFYMKLKHKHKEWKIGYAFYSNDEFKDITLLNQMQETIVTHPGSNFNKRKLVTKLTENGSMTLTDTSLTVWDDGVETKEEIDENRFNELKRSYFGL